NRKGKGSNKGRSYDRSRRDRQRGSQSGGFGGPGPRSRLEDTDADVTMSDSSQDNSSQHRLKYDKKWLLPALQNICSVPFTFCPFSYFLAQSKYIGGVFYIESSCCLLFLSQQCMAKRFDGSQQALDLNNIRTDPDLVSQNIEVVLNRKTNMEAVMKIIEENIPELTGLNLSNNRIHKLDELTNLVTKAPNLKTLNLSHNELKSDRELEKVKGLKLVELWLNRNPLCDLFKDQASYISAVRQKFPRLLKLDGHDLPAPIGFDVETPTIIPPCKGSCFGSDEIKVLILQFLTQYYSIYDSGDRQPLLDAYHDGASLSLTTPYSTQNPSRSSLGEYHKDTRNLKRIKDSTVRFRLLKHTRLNVVAFLNELPKTQHDIASFNVDVNTFTNTLLSFTVSGVFKEVAVDGKSRESTMAFSRVFVTVPAGNSGLCIVNDQLFIRMATTEEIRRAFVAPAPTPSSSPVPTLTAPQQEMLTAFSQKSGMNLEWSQKCLLDNEWDFNKAAQVFTQLKTDGKIPEVAFTK
uniref:Nuclear RNA export factor 1 n=1 Tax=Cyclopterus lumpus TaxID=8103 RepID=A0A8C2XIG7_CYCLU